MFELIKAFSTMTWAGAFGFMIFWFGLVFLLIALIGVFKK